MTDIMTRFPADIRSALPDLFEKGRRLVPCATELGRYGTIQDNPQILWSLVLGLLAFGVDYYEITSNREMGDGRPDIAMKPRPGVPQPGVILELKSPALPPRASQKRIAAALEAAAREARDQIDEKRYAEEMERELAERDHQPFNLSTFQPFNSAGRAPARPALRRRLPRQARLAGEVGVAAGKAAIRGAAAQRHGAREG